MCEVDNLVMMTAMDLKNSIIAGHALWEISNTCVDTKLKDIEITCIICNSCIQDRPQLPSSVVIKLQL